MLSLLTAKSAANYGATSTVTEIGTSSSPESFASRLIALESRTVVASPSLMVIESSLAVGVPLLIGVIVMLTVAVSD